MLFCYFLVRLGGMLALGRRTILLFMLFCYFLVSLGRRMLFCYFLVSLGGVLFYYFVASLMRRAILGAIYVIIIMLTNSIIAK